MSEISTRLREYVNDPSVSGPYGEWGALRPDQRRQIRELCDACDGHERAADNAMFELEKRKWIPVTERLPAKDGKYLVARLEGSKHSISVRKFRKEVPCWYRGYCGHWERRTNGITHWMPLPEPPERSDAE